MRLTLVSPQAAASNDGSGNPDDPNAVFELRPGAYSVATLHASLLAGAEEVDIMMASGGTWKTVTDKDGNVQKLTSSINQIVIDAPGRYGIMKDVTAGNCGVYADLG